MNVIVIVMTITAPTRIARIPLPRSAALIRDRLRSARPKSDAVRTVTSCGLSAPDLCTQHADIAVSGHPHKNQGQLTRLALPGLERDEREHRASVAESLPGRVITHDAEHRVVNLERIADLLSEVASRPPPEHQLIGGLRSERAS